LVLAAGVMEKTAAAAAPAGAQMPATMAARMVGKLFEMNTFITSRNRIIGRTGKLGNWKLTTSLSASEHPVTRSIGFDMPPSKS
jgi:hypothetical protein